MKEKDKSFWKRFWPPFFLLGGTLTILGALMYFVEDYPGLVGGVIVTISIIGIARASRKN